MMEFALELNCNRLSTALDPLEITEANLIVHFSLYLGAFHRTRLFFFMTDLLVEQISCSNDQVQCNEIYWTRERSRSKRYAIGIAYEYVLTWIPVLD